jgi:hypothetical protein
MQKEPNYSGRDHRGAFLRIPVDSVIVGDERPPIFFAQCLQPLDILDPAFGVEQIALGEDLMAIRCC